MVKCDNGCGDQATPALAEYATYHVNVIKSKWELIWTGRLFLLPAGDAPSSTETGPKAWDSNQWSDLLKVPFSEVHRKFFSTGQGKVNEVVREWGGPPNIFPDILILFIFKFRMRCSTVLLAVMISPYMFGSGELLWSCKLKEILSRKRDFRLVQLLMRTTTYARSSPVRHVSIFTSKGGCLTLSNLQISVVSSCSLCTKNPLYSSNKF